MGSTAAIPQGVSVTYHYSISATCIFVVSWVLLSQKKVNLNNIHQTSALAFVLLFYLPGAPLTYLCERGE